MAAPAACGSLAQLALANTTITVAEAAPAGGFAPPGGKPNPNLPAFCRVAGVLKPSSDSDIRFEVWMPASGWNGKYHGVGNGGFAGSISYAGLVTAVSRGYAASSTDTGHQAGGIDAGWALGHPEKVIDYGYRAIHETAVTAKAVIRAFYGEGPRRSYFNSCSNGGRQALMEAQRFPEDYDGIIAGAPANYWTHLLSAAAWDVKATLGTPESYFAAAKLPAIQAAVRAACDAQDGVNDGVLEDPSLCRFDAATLLCKGPESDGCLTASQIEALKKIYDGPRDARGRRVFPGYSPGGEAEAGGWGAWITGPAPEKAAMFLFATQYFKNIVYQDPAWDFRTFDLERDTKAAVQKTAHILNSNNPDLKRFRARGGKLIVYHGWCDAAIPAQNAIDYFKSVEKKMGAKNAATFVRLFLAPGVQHCGGGSGPDSFGQMNGVEGDAQHDLDAALERWVEEGVAPERLIASKYKSGTNPASGVVRTRPLCPYPQVARWNGTGGTDDAANFTCAAPAKK
jgi:feruloyl esterase